MAILADLKDPRIRDVTVTYVEVSADLRVAKVHVSVMGDETKQNLSLHGLQSAAGYLQGKVNDRIETRYTPRLTFILDQGVKKSIEMNELLSQLVPRPEADADITENGDANVTENIDGEPDADPDATEREPTD